MDDNAFDYNEYVTSKLCEWADPLTRLEKKRIQRQVVNQNCREWLKDLVTLDNEEIEMLAEDEGEVREIKKDHAKYVRKAVFDEYTFKKKPIAKDELEDRYLEESTRKKTMVLLEELRRQEREEVDLADTGYAGFLRGKDSKMDELPDKTPLKGKQWFTRPWLAKRGVSNESVCVTDDRNRHIFVQLQRMIKQGLEDNVNDKILDTVRLMKAGILFDATYVKVQEMVSTIVENARRRVPESDLKWMDKLELDAPETITDNMIDEIFEEAPLSYFENKVRTHFVEELITPITENLVRRIMTENDPTLITTKFKRAEVLALIKEEVQQYQHVCTNFMVAEKVAKIIAEEVVDVTRFRLDVPGPDSEPSEPERNIKELFDQRLAKIEKDAEKQAKKNLEHLRYAQRPRKDPLKITAKNDEYGTNNNCKCHKISEKGGRKRPFVYPEYKKKANYYFYNKFISDKNKNSTVATLYPNAKNKKLVCDDHWMCTPVPLERELRDIPYRFSYAPQHVVKQIQRTKCIKKADHPLIKRILNKMEKTKKVVDKGTILKMINEENGRGKLLDKAESSISLRDTSELNNWSVTMSAPSESSSKNTDSTKTTEVKDKESEKTGKRTSNSTFTLQSSMAVDDTHLIKANMPQRFSRQLQPMGSVSRQSRVVKASEAKMYHKHVMEGYNYERVPVTPCRFHSLKKINAVLKRFETAGGPAAMEYHFGNRQAPVSVDELLPVPTMVDDDRQRKKEEDSSLWTRALNDSRLKRMAKFRKIYKKDPVFGFTLNWESPTYKCPT